MNNTPLRYPGGKSIMSPFFEDIFKFNTLENVVYCEPYAGGAGTAINLLLNGTVDQLKINDASLGVYSFWKYLLEDSEFLLNRTNEIEVNLIEWQKQRLIYKNAKTPSKELAFATFFLSRTNRSGILHAGPMGGQNPLNQSKAKYKLDCRFNKENLLDRLKAIVKRKECIEVSNLDAIEFLISCRNEKNLFIYLDPPYYVQGSGLYMNHYRHEDHEHLANFLKKAEFNWMLSYDNVEPIRNLYKGFDLYQFNLIYTAQDVKQGSELLTHSKKIALPANPCIKRPKNSIPIQPLEIV